MSTKKKKTAPTGVRYSAKQKKEVIDFVKAYNSTKGRGGQSAATRKFNITPLTISGWLKAAGVKSPQRAARRIAKPATSLRGRTGSSKKGVRYSPERKQEVVDFVNAHNAKNGRGGQNQAAKKFKLSVLTVSSWLKAAGVRKPAARAIVKKSAGKAAAKVSKSRKGMSELEALKAAIRALVK
jgi:hypothetical protein